MWVKSSSSTAPVRRVIGLSALAATAAVSASAGSVPDAMNIHSHALDAESEQLVRERAMQ